MQKKKLIIGAILAIVVIAIVYYMYKKSSPSKTIAPNVTSWINSMNDPEKTKWANAVSSWFTQSDLDNLSQAVSYFSSNTMMPGPLTDWWNTTSAKVG